MRTFVWQLLLCIFAASASADALPPALEQLSRSALVKFVLEAIGLDGQTLPVLPSIGHGVYISPDGKILTAAHVLFPPAGWAPAASSYRLKIFVWDDANDTWGESVDIDSGALAASVTYGKSLPVADCRPSQNFPPMLCERSRFDRPNDFAVLQDPRQKAPNYVDVIGPEETVDRTQALKLNWRQFVVSEFHQDRLVAIDVQQASPRGSTAIEALGGLQFIEGVSGSPLFIETPQPVRSIFVAGIVVRRYKDDDPVFAAQPSTRAQVALLPEIINSVGSDLDKSLAGSAPVPACPPGSPSPYNASLLASYFVSLRDISDGEFKSRCACLDPFSTWESTAAVLRFRRRNRSAVATASAAATQGSSAGGLINTSQLSAAADARLATFLSEAYASKVDPLSVVEDEQFYLARVCDVAPTCQPRACPTCDTWDIACIASRNSCELEKAIQQAQCEIQRTATIRACQQQRQESLAVLRSTIIAVRDVSISPAEYLALRRTKFGAVLVEHELNNAKLPLYSAEK